MDKAPERIWTPEHDPKDDFPFGSYSKRMVDHYAVEYIRADCSETKAWNSAIDAMCEKASKEGFLSVEQIMELRK